MKIPSLWKQVMGERKRRRVLLSLKTILTRWKSLNSEKNQMSGQKLLIHMKLNENSYNIEYLSPPMLGKICEKT